MCVPEATKYGLGCAGLLPRNSRLGAPIHRSKASPHSAWGMPMRGISSWSSFIGKLNPFSDTITGKREDLSKRYQVLNEIGAGRYGTVRRARLRADPEKKFAVKSVPKELVEDMNELRNEIEILRKMDHPHVLGLVEALEDDKEIHIVSNLCKGGELFDRIVTNGTFSERDAARLMRQVLLALEYCHTKLHIVHRDIKPENLLYYTRDADSDLCLCDFGMSRVFQDQEQMHATCGSPSYVAPEVLDKDYTFKCDLWSAGVILYILLCGKVPFGGNSDREIMRNVTRGKYSLTDPAWEHISDSAKSLVAQLLEVDPVKRLTASQALAHPWIEQVENTSTVPLNRTLTNMKKFTSYARLKRLSLEVIGQHLASSQQEQHDQYMINLREIFQALDKDGKGQIRAEDLARAIVEDSKKLNSYNVLSSAQDLADILRDADTDGNGMIDLKEFFAAAINETIYMQDEKLTLAFNFFDKDKSGTITLDELREAYGPDVSITHLEEDFQKYDLNNDGVIDYDEFVQQMSGRHQDDIPSETNTNMDMSGTKKNTSGKTKKGV